MENLPSTLQNWKQESAGVGGGAVSLSVTYLSCEETAGVQEEEKAVELDQWVWI